MVVKSKDTVKGKVIDVVCRNENLIVYVVFSRGGRLFLDEATSWFSKGRLFLGQDVMLGIYGNNIVVEELCI